jgi:hypothetical protein
LAVSWCAGEWSCFAFLLLSGSMNGSRIKYVWGVSPTDASSWFVQSRLLERVAAAAPFKHLVRLSLLVLIIAYSTIFFSHNKSV